MLQQITTDQLMQELSKKYNRMPKEFILSKAERIIAETDERLEPYLKEYLDSGKEKEFEYGDYSLMAIESMQKVGYLEAIEMMSVYMNDPDKGKSMILRPMFGRRY